MQKWEYYTATWNWKGGLIKKWQWGSDSMKEMSFSAGLDHLGSMGWEMCASTTANQDTHNIYEYVFKRPVA